MKLRKTKQFSAWLADKHGIKCAPKTLEKLRSVGGGPPFHKFGNAEVYYSEEDGDRWVVERLSKPLNSTAELANGVGVVT